MSRSRCTEVASTVSQESLGAVSRRRRSRRSGSPRRAACASPGARSSRGTDLFSLSQKQLRRRWGSEIAYVAQDASGALDPLRRIEYSLAEPMRFHLSLSKREIERAIGRAAGGRRIAGARGVPAALPARVLRRSAAAHRARGRDVVQAVGAHPRRADDRARRHDAGDDHRADQAADRRDRRRRDRHQPRPRAPGRVRRHPRDHVRGRDRRGGHGVRRCSTAPRHPYTAALLDAAPQIEDTTVVRGIPGLPPPGAVSGRCSYAERCRARIDACLTTDPALEHVGGDRRVRCIRAAELGVITSDRLLGVAGVPFSAGPNALLTASNIVCAYGSHDQAVVGARRQLQRGAWRDARHRRRVGLGQVDPAARHRGAARAALG